MAREREKGASRTMVFLLATDSPFLFFFKLISKKNEKFSNLGAGIFLLVFL